MFIWLKNPQISFLRHGACVEYTNVFLALNQVLQFVFIKMRLDYPSMRRLPVGISVKNIHSNVLAREFGDYVLQTQNRLFLLLLISCFVCQFNLLKCNDRNFASIIETRTVLSQLTPE
jgi:hypothetical protein